MWRKIDLSNQELQQLAGFAGRIGELFKTASSQEPLKSLLDDLLGAVYALVYAEEARFKPRGGQVEDTVIGTRATKLAAGHMRDDGAWMAGFHLNSAMHRISGTYDRILKIVAGQSKNRRDLTQAKYQQWTGQPWNDSSSQKVVEEIVHLKHREGIYKARVVGPNEAVSAVGEQLDLAEAWAVTLK